MDFLKSLLNADSASRTPPEPSPAVVLPTHPYYPTHIEIPGFVAHDLTVPQLLGAFAAGCSVILSSTWLLASAFAPRMRTLDKFIALWFCLSMEEWQIKRVAY